MVEAADDRAPESVQTFILDGMKSWHAVPCLLEDAPGMIPAAIVDHNNFVRDIVETQLYVKLLDGGSDAALFISSRNDDAKTMKLRRCPRRTGRSRVWP